MTSSYSFTFLVAYNGFYFLNLAAMNIHYWRSGRENIMVEEAHATPFSVVFFGSNPPPHTNHIWQN